MCFLNILIIKVLNKENIFRLERSKFISTLKKCSKTELSEFQEWLNSSFHNNSSQASRLYQWILKTAPKFESKKLSREKAFQFLFKGENYKEAKINHVLSLLTRQLFDFLSYKNYQNSSSLAQICLMDELLDRDLDHLMLQEGRRLKKQKEQSELKHSSSFFEDYLYYKQLDEHFIRKPKRIYDENLQLKNDNLDLFYVTTKLKIACDMANRNKVIQANYHCRNLEYILEQTKNTDEIYHQHPAVRVYYQALKTIEGKQLEDYQLLKTLLAEHLNVFPKDDLTTLYDYVLNFCIQQINKGNTSFYSEILEVYQFLLANKINFQNGYLQEWDYKNIITVGTRLNELAWTEQFIHDYKKDLPPNVRENAYVYNLANFYYSTKAYKKSLQLLHEVKFMDSSYHLGAKTIQLKSYYELGESEPFFALTDAFRIYLLRNKGLSTYWKQANLNMVKLATRIFKLKEEQDFITTSVFKDKHQRILDRVSKTEHLANTQWLLSCLKDLEH